MKTVTKRQFLEAQKIIRKYKEQLLKGQYGFLYYTEYNLDDGETKYIEAKNIDDACIKMLKWVQSIKKDIVAIDYEVEFEGNYIDITYNKDLMEFVG